MQTLSLFLSHAIDKMIKYHSELSDPSTEINKFCDLITSVLQAITSCRGLPMDHYFIFDKVGYFLIKFKEEITAAYWTEICH